MTPAADEGVTCPVCGGSLPHSTGPRRFIKRGALVMRSDPLQLEWNGRPISLTPLELNLMAAVMVRGRATRWEIRSILRQSSGTLRVVVYRIRTKFHQIGAADPLETVPNWGLKLRVEADRDGTTSAWIGADDSFETAFLDDFIKATPLTKEGLASAGLTAPLRRPPP